jgi:ribosomal-protein-alanine N-acetyltransferase
MRIDSERLEYSPVSAADIDSLHALWTDPEVRKHLWDDEVIPRETVEGVVSASIAAFASHGFGQWAVREMHQGPIIGFCGLRFIEETPDVEILYGFLPSYWGKSYATEAATAILAYAIDKAGLNEVVADIDPPNRASVRVAEKLGLEFVKEIERKGLPALRYRATPD